MTMTVANTNVTTSRIAGSTLLVTAFPTLVESGVAGFDVSAWFAFYLPVRTPPDIVRKAGADIDAALQHPPVRQRLEALGGDIVGGPPEKLSAFLKSEMDKWGPLIRAANIKVNE